MTFRTTAYPEAKAEGGQQHAGESRMEWKGGTRQFCKSCAYGEIG